MASQLNFEDAPIPSCQVPSTYVGSRLQGLRNWANSRQFELTFAAFITLAFIVFASVNYQNQALINSQLGQFRNLTNKTDADIEDLFEKVQENSQQFYKQKEIFSEWQEKQDTEFESLQNELSKIESERISPLEEQIKKTDFHAKAAAARSCQELYKHGFTQSGYYLVDPDGRYLGQSSFEVYCLFVPTAHWNRHHYVNDIHIETIIQPKTSEFEMSSTSDEDFKKEIQYNATDKQIAALITNSVCYQTITFKCLVMPLHYEETNHGYWKDRSGIERYFFDGYDFKGRNCECRNTPFKQCHGNANALCNCDIRSKDESEDEGTITSDWILPITEVGYKFHGHTFNPFNLQSGSATFVIGDLRCRGNFIAYIT